MEEKLVKYSNQDLTVLWMPQKCIHSGVCVRGLGQVFNPKIKKWVNANAASSQLIADQIDKCPSGALKYQFNT